jgi:hypothetical protein
LALLLNTFWCLCFLDDLVLYILWLLLLSACYIRSEKINICSIYWDGIIL